MLQGKTPKDLWSEDMDVFMQELDVSYIITRAHKRESMCMYLHTNTVYKVT